MFIVQIDSKAASNFVFRFFCFVYLFYGNGKEWYGMNLLPTNNVEYAFCLC